VIQPEGNSRDVSGDFSKFPGLGIQVNNWYWTAVSLPDVSRLADLDRLFATVNLTTTAFRLAIGGPQVLPGSAAFLHCLSVPFSSLLISSDILVVFILASVAARGRAMYRAVQ
jgi:hypothetical protein